MGREERERRNKAGQSQCLFHQEHSQANVVPTVYAKRGSRKASPFWLCKLNRLMDLESEADLHTSEGLVAVSAIVAFDVVAMFVVG